VDLPARDPDWWQWAVLRRTGGRGLSVLRAQARLAPAKLPLGCGASEAKQDMARASAGSLRTFVGHRRAFAAILSKPQHHSDSAHGARQLEFPGAGVAVPKGESPSETTARRPDRCDRRSQGISRVA